MQFRSLTVPQELFFSRVGYLVIRYLVEDFVFRGHSEMSKEMKPPISGSLDQLVRSDIISTSSIYCDMKEI